MTPAPVTPVDNPPPPIATKAVRETQLVAMLESGLSSAVIAKALRMPASSVRCKARRLRAEGNLTTAPQSRAALGGSKIATIVEGIEAEAARRAKLARLDYTDATAALKAEHRARQDAIASRESETLKAIETWRVRMIADAEGGPVPLGEIRDMRPAGPKTRAQERPDEARA